ncbi:1-aminocyclopropane-1-carboxylate oxidase homolog 1 [Linum perenne]
MASSSPEYDRLAELNAFDQTKAGVKGLVDSGITTIPRMFHDGLPYSADDPNFIFPIINLTGYQDPEMRKHIIAKIRDASENWGFFQVVNHGVPANILDEMLAGVHRFFEQDVELKKPYFDHDLTKKVVYTSNYDLYTAPVGNWRDVILFHMAPDPPQPDELPSCCREIVAEYSGEILKVGDLLMELLSEALGLDPNHLKGIGCREGLGLASSYYPTCPQPELTLGSTHHTDLGFVTVLLQDHVGGLQVHRHNSWLDVPFIKDGLVVNVADMLQLISNDKFKSAEHRVRVTSVEPRVSVAAYFGNPSLASRMYGPIEELLTEDNPAKYKEITIREFFLRSYQKGFDGNSVLPLLKL